MIAARGFWGKLRKRLAACPLVQGGMRVKQPKATAPEAEIEESPEEILFRMKFGKR